MWRTRRESETSRCTRIFSKTSTAGGLLALNTAGDRVRYGDLGGDRPGILSSVVDLINSLITIGGVDDWIYVSFALDGRGTSPMYGRWRDGATRTVDDRNGNTDVSELRNWG